MSFELTEWKNTVEDRFKGWMNRFQKGGAESAYFFLAAAAFLPVVQAVHADGDWGALAVLGSAVGSNLLANMVQRLKDKSEAEIAAELEQAAGADPALLREIDALLEKLQAIQEAERALPEADKQWFAGAIRAELARVKSGIHYEAWLTGDGAIAQGEGARAVGAGGVLIEGLVTGDVIAPGGTKLVAPDPRQIKQEETENARRKYLARLRRFCQSLPLAVLGGEEGAEVDITLDHVYIDLDTTLHLPVKQIEKIRKGLKPDKAAFAQGEMVDRPGKLALDPETQVEMLSVLDAASVTPRLVLLGEPGAGKSTFVRKWLALQAASLLGECPPPPGCSPALLPILVTLRDLAPHLARLDLGNGSARDDQQALVEIFRRQVRDELVHLNAAEYSDALLERLESGVVMLVLDGLDEVPSGLRERARLAVAALVETCSPQRILVTCRVRSYTGAAVLPTFQSFTIAPFDDKKIRGFVQAWYRAQQDFGRLDTAQAELRVRDLSTAAVSPDLVELSGNPMMLTSMAIIHQKEIGLPRERVRLYSLVVDVLLRRWQKHKTGEAGLAPSSELAAFLRDDLRLRGTLERLAYEAHRAGSSDKKAADLSRSAALALLEESAHLGGPGLASEFLDYVDQRAGLLLGRGGDDERRPSSYSFPHRTFQEYLAGCHLAGQRDLARTFYHHAGEGELWNLAALLGFEELYYNRRNVSLLLDLAYALCPSDTEKDERCQRAQLWSGEIARLLGLEIVERDKDRPDGGKQYLKRLKPRLLKVMAGSLPPAERVEAGRVLGRLGDPRLDVLHADQMLFCLVPHSKFTMGDGKDTHLLFLPDFFISRCPVTNAQYAEFVDSKGYEPQGYWKEAQKEGWWQDGRFKGKYDSRPRTAPPDFGEPFNLPNHPVSGISWYEALAFTRWLEERLRTAGGVHVLGEGRLVEWKEKWHATLPSEAEWEKAARGDKVREYPWGERFDVKCANTAETGIGTTSAVGCFTGGASQYDVLDLSGNVWEWTRSVAKEYPYRPEDGREDLHSKQDRILRGGAFDGSRDYARSAIRFRLIPDITFWYFGFRIIVSAERSGAPPKRRPRGVPER